MVLVRYTLMRIMIFVGFLAIFNLLGFDLFWALLSALVVSMIVSYFLLRPDRERLAAGLEGKVEERMTKKRERLAAERTTED